MAETTAEYIARLNREAEEHYATAPEAKPMPEPGEYPE